MKKIKNKTSVAYGIEKLLKCYLGALVVLSDAAVEGCTEVMLMVMEYAVCVWCWYGGTAL